MRRREFLRRTAGSALGWELAVWAAACRIAESSEQAGDPKAGAGPAAGAGQPPAAEMEVVRAAFERAREGRVPLLLLVLPADLGDRREHGQAFGELVLHGPPRAVAALATCQLACARIEAARAALAHELQLPAGPCTALVVEPQTREVRVLRVDLAVPFSGVPMAEEESAIRARIERLASALEGALAPDARSLDLRLGTAARARGLELAPGVAAALDELAARVRGELVAKPPGGAAWATLELCGIRIDHPDLADAPGAPCGTAYVPALSRRFLFYLAEGETR